MYARGIEKIREDEFCKKLLPYYKDKRYSSLFKLVFTNNERTALNLYDSIYDLRGDKCLWSKPKERENLYIDISSEYYEYIFSRFLENHPENDIQLIKQIAEEFSIRYPFEKK